jgi:hypothetical protein
MRPVLLWLVLARRVSLVGTWRLERGLDLVFRPRPELSDQNECGRSIQGRRLLSLVAELDCPRRQYIGFGKLIRCLDVVFLNQADEVAQRRGSSRRLRSERPVRL